MIENIWTQHDEGLWLNFCDVFFPTGWWFHFFPFQSHLKMMIPNWCLVPEQAGTTPKSHGLDKSFANDFKVILETTNWVRGPNLAEHSVSSLQTWWLKGTEPCTKLVLASLRNLSDVSKCLAFRYTKILQIWGYHQTTNEEMRMDNQVVGDVQRIPLALPHRPKVLLQSSGWVVFSARDDAPIFRMKDKRQCIFSSCLFLGWILLDVYLMFLHVWNCVKSRQSEANSLRLTSWDSWKQPGSVARCTLGCFGLPFFFSNINLAR